MQQRRVRLGDIVDDYCPRERRVTNHAVVAMIEDQVKQTRCATCDADHEYKQGRAPSVRRRKAEGVLAQEPPEALGRPRHATAAVEEADEVDAEVDAGDVLEAESAVEADAVVITEITETAVVEAVDVAAEPDVDEERERPEDQWVHRRLIRAQLPRVEGQVPERKATDFTVQPNTDRDGNSVGHRHGPRAGRPHGQGGQPSNSQRAGGGGHRQGGGQGQGGQRQGGGNRPGTPGGQRGGGRPDNGQARGPQGSGSGSGPGSGRRRGR